MLIFITVIKPLVWRLIDYTLGINELSTKLGTSASHCQYSVDAIKSIRFQNAGKIF